MGVSPLPAPAPPSPARASGGHDPPVPATGEQGRQALPSTRLRPPGQQTVLGSATAQWGARFQVCAPPVAAVTVGSPGTPSRTTQVTHSLDDKPRAQCVPYGAAHISGEGPSVRCVWHRCGHRAQERSQPSPGGPGLASCQGRPERRRRMASRGTVRKLPGCSGTQIQNGSATGVEMA